MFGGKAPKPRDDSGKSLSELLSEENLTPADVRLLMAEYVIRGEFPDETSRRRKRQARLALREPESSERVTANRKLQALRAGGATCHWRGRNSDGNLLICTNSRMRNPRNNLLTLHCGFHQTLCVAVHPTGLVGVEEHNALGLCTTHYVAKLHKRPPSLGGAENVPGVVALEGKGISHPLAPFADQDVAGASSKLRDGPVFESDVFDKLYVAIRRRQYKITGIAPRDAVKAVLRLQSHFRRHLAVRVVKRIRHSRLLIERHRAATSLQKAFRSRRHAIDFPFMQKMMHAAAVAIQRGYRMHRLLHALEKDREAARAAIEIQRWFRSVRLRNNFQHMRIRLRARIEGLEKARANVVITGLMSRFIARCRLRKQALRLQRRVDAARSIQRAFRWHLGWKRRHKVRAEIAGEFLFCETANRIQMAWLASKRRRIGRATRKKFLATILKLQAWVRGCSGRNQARRRRQELESVWAWMQPTLPRSYFADVIRAPDYSKIFDLSRLAKGPLPGAVLLPHSSTAASHRSRTVSVESSASGDGAPPSSFGEACDTIRLAHSSPIPASADDGAMMLPGPTSTSTSSANDTGCDATTEQRAAIHKQHDFDQAASEASEIQRVLNDVRHRMQQADRANSGLVAPHTFRRVLHEASFPPKAGRHLRKQFYELACDKINWHGAVSYAEALGARLFSSVVTPGHTESAHVYTTASEIAGAQTFQPMKHLPENQAALARRQFHGIDKSKNVVSKYGGRRSMTTAGTYAFENHPAMLPSIPQPVPGITGTNVPETIAIINMPGTGTPAVAVLTDADAYNADTRKRGPQTVRIQQAVLGSFLALAAQDVAGINAKARLELTDPDSCPPHRSASERRSGAFATLRREKARLAGATVSMSSALVIDEYLQAWQEGTAGTAPTPAGGRFARPRMRGRPLPPMRSDTLQNVPPSTSIGGTHSLSMEAEARQARAASSAIRDRYGASPPAEQSHLWLRGRPGRDMTWHAVNARGSAAGVETVAARLPLMRKAGERLVATEQTHVVYAEILKELRGPGSDGIDALQEEPPNKIIRLVVANFAFFSKFWKDLAKNLRCGVLCTEPEPFRNPRLTAVAPQPERAALFEALVRRLGIGSSVPTRAHQATAGQGDALKLARDTSRDMWPFSLPPLPLVPTPAPLAQCCTQTTAAKKVRFAEENQGTVVPLPSPGSCVPRTQLQPPPSTASLAIPGRNPNAGGEHPMPWSPQGSVIIVSRAIHSSQELPDAPSLSITPHSRWSCDAGVSSAAPAGGGVIATTGPDRPSLVWSDDHFHAPPYRPPAPIELPGCTKHLWLAPSDRCIDCQAYRKLPLPQPPCTFHASAIIAMAGGLGDVKATALSLLPHFSGRPRSDAIEPTCDPLSVLVVHIPRAAPRPLQATVQVFALCEDSNGDAWVIGWRLWTMVELRSASSPEVRRCRINSPHQVLRGKKLLYVRLTASNVVGAGTAFRVKTETALKKAARRHKLQLQRCVFYRHFIDPTEEERLLAAQLLH